MALALAVGQMETSRLVLGSVLLAVWQSAAKPLFGFLKKPTGLRFLCPGSGVPAELLGHGFNSLF